MKSMQPSISPESCPEGYEFQELIGQGGMGTVFRALDPVLKRTVAVKILNFDGSTGTNHERFFCARQERWLYSIMPTLSVSFAQDSTLPAIPTMSWNLWMGFHCRLS